MSKNSLDTILARLDEELGEADRVLKEVGHLLTVYTTKDRETRSKRCDIATLNAAHAAIKLGNTISALDGVLGAEPQRIKAEKMRANMDSAVEAIKKIRDCEMCPIFALIDSIYDDNHYQVWRKRPEEDWRNTKPLMLTPYPFTEHLTLFTTDEKYRKLLLGVVWSLGQRVTEELVSIATELYLKSAMQAALILLIYVDAGLQLAQENNPDLEVNPEIMRTRCWNVAQSHPDDQQRLLILMLDELLDTLGPTADFSCCGFRIE